MNLEKKREEKLQLAHFFVQSQLDFKKKEDRNPTLSVILIIKMASYDSDIYYFIVQFHVLFCFKRYYKLAHDHFQ